MKKNERYTGEPIAMKDIPSGIATYINAHFNNDMVLGIAKQSFNNTVLYVLDIDHNGILHHVKFDVEGNFVSEKNEITAETEQEHFTSVGSGD
jgi:ribosomal protein S11